MYKKFFSAQIASNFFCLLFILVSCTEQNDPLINKDNEEWIQGHNHSALELLNEVLQKNPSESKAEEVLFSALAWPVPFTEMGYWVRGLPAPGKHDGIGLDYGGRARHLTQRGWQIEYPEYQMFQGVALQIRIVIRALPVTVTLDNGNSTSIDPILVRIPSIENF